MSYYESDGNFLLCRFDNLTAREAYEYLARRGISYGFFHTPGSKSVYESAQERRKQTDRVIEALQELPGS